MKKMKYILRIIVFLSIFMIGILKLENIMENKSTEAVSKEYEKYEEDTFDVLFFGSSITRDGIYPMVLYKDFGIAAYNLGCGSQRIPNSYFLIKKAIEEQSPEVIVLNCSMALDNKKYASIGALHYITDMMDFGERYEMVFDLVEDKELRIRFLFPLYEYHSRWNELEKQDFAYTEHSSLGTNMLFKTNAVETNTEITLESQELLEIPEEYLIKIIELCKEKGVELLLTQMPIDFGYGPIVDAVEMQKYFNGIQMIADEYDVPYLNFMHIEDSGIDYATDFQDRRHMNYYGATKITSYIGKYLKENYSLPDVRSNPEYAFLATGYEEFKEYCEEKLLVSEKDIYRYLSLLSELEDYTIVLSVKDIQGYALNQEIADKMKMIGFSQADTLLERVYHGYIGIVSNGKSIYEEISNDHAALNYKGEVCGKEISVVSKTLKGGNKSSIKMDGTEYSVNKRGFNMVVIDNYSGEVVASVCFDTHTKELTCYR